MNYITKQAIRGLMAAVMLVVAVTLSETAAVQAADYPNRDITFIIPYGPGGGSDMIGRKFAEELENVLRSNVVVENKPGASGTIGVGIVVRARPDGYTIGQATNTIVGYQPLVNKTLAFKTPDDYQPIVKILHRPALLFTRGDAPWQTFEEFMTHARKNPGKVRVSVSGLGGAEDLVMRLLNKVANTNIVSIPLTGGSGEALVALLGGRVEAFAGGGLSNRGHVQAGTIKCLAVFQKGKYEPFPNAVSAPDAGYDVTLPVAYYLVAPKGLPKDVLNKLVTASLQVLRSEAFLKFAERDGFIIDEKGPEALKEEIIEYNKTFGELAEIRK